MAFYPLAEGCLAEAELGLPGTLGRPMYRESCSGMKRTWPTTSFGYSQLCLGWKQAKLKFPGVSLIKEDFFFLTYISQSTEK